MCRTWLEDGGTDGDGPWGKSCNAFMNRTAFQPCLFDLYGDISETIDIATAEAAKVQAMWASLNATVSTSYVSAFRGSATTAQRPDRQPPPGAPQIPHASHTSTTPMTPIFTLTLQISRSPSSLLGPCNSSCALEYWAQYGGTGTEAQAPDCGVPGCTA